MIKANDLWFLIVNDNNRTGVHGFRAGGSVIKDAFCACKENISSVHLFRKQVCCQDADKDIFYFAVNNRTWFFINHTFFFNLNSFFFQLTCYWLLIKAPKSCTIRNAVHHLCKLYFFRGSCVVQFEYWLCSCVYNSFMLHSIDNFPHRFIRCAIIHTKAPLRCGAEAVRCLVSSLQINTERTVKGCSLSVFSSSVSNGISSYSICKAFFNL